MANAKQPAASLTIIQPDPNAGQSFNDTIALIRVTVDATPTEQHEYVNSVTDHPVEAGFNVTDHSRPEPDQVTFECLISDTPLSLDQLQRASNSGAAALGVDTDIVAVPGYSKKALDDLRQLQLSGVLCTVSTTLKTYTSMMIVSISVPRDSKTFAALRFNMTMKYVRIVQNKLTTVRKATDPRVQPKKAQGKQTTQAPPPIRSVAKDGVHSYLTSKNPTLSGTGQAATSE